MRAVLQRVSRASVTVDNEIISSISSGLLILLGIEQADERADAEWLAGKVANMRIFEDEAGLMNISLVDAGADALVVSQFTLHASTKKGNRPSFIKAARPEHSEPLYEEFTTILAQHLGKPVAQGKFGAMMDVALVNDGPVTIVMDTKSRE